MKCLVENKEKRAINSHYVGIIVSFKCVFCIHLNTVFNIMLDANSFI